MAGGARPVADESVTTVRATGWEFIVVDCAAQSEARGHGFEMERDGVTLSLLDEADDVLIVGQVRWACAASSHSWIRLPISGLKISRVVVTKLSAALAHEVGDRRRLVGSGYSGSTGILHVENSLERRIAASCCASFTPAAAASSWIWPNGSSDEPSHPGTLVRGPRFSRRQPEQGLRSVLRGLRGKRLRVLSSENPAGAAHHVTRGGWGSRG